MEFVGRVVKKDFKGLGNFSGAVESYDPSTGLFKVFYEDGDFEEFNLSEITTLLDGNVNADNLQSAGPEPAKRPSRVGRKPKKRRRTGAGNDSRTSSANLVHNNCSRMSSGDGFGETLENGIRAVEDCNRTVDLSSEFNKGLKRKGVIDLNRGLSFEDDLDLNDGGLNFNRGLDLNNEIDLNVNGDTKRSGVIDLNVDVNEEGDGNSKQFELAGCVDTQKREYCFDLNLGLDDASRSLDADCYVQLTNNTSSQMDHKVERREGNGDCQEIQVNGDVENTLGSRINPQYGVFLGNSKRDAASGVLDDNSMNVAASSEIQSTGLSEAGTPTVQEDQRGVGNTKSGKSGRKRRKLSDSVNVTSETVLRRSTRRGRAMFSARDHIISTLGSVACNDASSLSPAVSAVSEELPAVLGSEEIPVFRQEEIPLVLGREKSQECFVFSPKLQLPPSSGNLNLEGIPVLEIFSIYSFLRSFSTLLFLSPFKLCGFVEAMKCNAPNLLFDSIHLSLLQILRKHLESLPEESVPSLSQRFRGLNWDFLDLITWPIFMVEYLLMHGFRLNSVIDLCHLNLFETEYYKQPASVKITILQWLCDDVIEVEATRSELNRRTLAADPSVNFDQNMKFEASRKRRTVIDVSGTSCLTDEEVDETTDRNIDECCLCKMDGNLICCDGCPAAFHTRCVGVASSLLPEGDWYCPECLMDKDKPWTKLGKTIRGARLLGIDPYGRRFYSSCGYLLVLDTRDTESSFNYYHRNDLPSFIEVLKSCETLYGTILNAIFKHWNVLPEANAATSILDSQDVAVCSDFLRKGKPLSIPNLQEFVAPSADCARKKSVSEGKFEEKFMTATISGEIGCEVSELVKVEPTTVNHSMKMEIASASSEGSAAISQAVTGIQNYSKGGLESSSEFDRKVKNTDNPSANCDGTPSNISTKGCPLEGHFDMDYVNRYCFARSVSLVVEELTSKSSDKNIEHSLISVEEIISRQLKAISNKSTDFFWPNIHNFKVDARKEKCGWCFSCRYPDDERDCLFLMNDTGPHQESCLSEFSGLPSRKNKKGHLIDVICYILCIEDRLHGLLSGPWLNPHYSKLWHKSVIKALDVASLKHLLLMLESNLHRLAFSAEWLKHVDSLATMGSASHVIISSSRMCSRNGIGRKRARYSDLETNSSSNAASGLGLFWWRGGRLSRHLFSWKFLPRSLVSKAARQGGCKKVPGIIYPDGSELAKRSKCVIWRAAVETSQSIEQLALQIRELDANIKWDDIEDTYILLKMDKESVKSIRAFRKAIVRRKCLEESVVKYLLDFGKRRFIPDIVMKHGTMLEESSNGRKKYWVEESHIPLYLLKGFEERRIARWSNKMSSGKFRESKTLKKSSKSGGFTYLFSRAERLENYQCRHCKKDVLIREAVSCQYCKGYFHKRHVKKSAGAIAAKCTYACYKCHEGAHKFDIKKYRPQPQRSKKASNVVRPLRKKIYKKVRKEKKPAQSQNKQKNAVVIPLRRSARKVKCVSIQSQNTGDRKKGKKTKSKKGTSKKSRQSSWQKKRTQVFYTYWLNGLLFSRKQHDEGVIHFKSKRLLINQEDLNPTPYLPRCGLCFEQEFTSTLIYIGCEICEEWFHGDAFGLTADNVANLIGFKCHKCRNRSPPICSHLHDLRSVEAQSDKPKCDTELECADRASNDLEPPSVVCVNPQVDEELTDLVMTEQSNDKEMQLDTLPATSRALPSDVDSGKLPFGVEQKTDHTHNCNDWRPPYLLMESGEKTSLEHNAVKNVTSLIELEILPRKSILNVVETELISVGHDHSKNDLVKASENPESV